MKRITKKEFYQRGAFSNPSLHRKMRGGKWTYWTK